ncbi:MAG: exodeoxyribonuclease V subunit gamma [Burkholderiaceae bacterium]
MATSHIAPGLIALHSNRAESLAEAVVAWLQRHPLDPLEPETLLVQSNGVAEWLKMQLATAMGVTAATRVELPARFLWRTYRQVLGSHTVPPDSPLDKLPLTWRLMQHLPTVLTEPALAPVAHYLRQPGADRLLQLSTHLADLFDQYQVHRPDWLDAWASGLDHLPNPHGAALALPPGAEWQPVLWRALLAGLSPEQRQATRPQLHQRVLAALAQAEPGSLPVARRVVVFGMAQLPSSTLALLAALAPHTQVLLAVPNPCRFHWADTLAGRELLQAQRHRLPLKNGVSLAQVPLDDMHAHGHPLLSAWGQQSRDFIRQLDAFDDAEATRQRFALPRIDLFDDGPPTEGTWLEQVQHHIRDLVPPAESTPAPPAATDRSLVFHAAHSPVRELEVLHDQLLALLGGPQRLPGLSPRQIVVMVPGIDAVAPAIRAVFGQYPTHDPRHIPFDIADLDARDHSPLMAATHWLLSLPRQRATHSELADLLAVPAVAARFGVAEDQLPTLLHWMAGAGVRWGLNADHRSRLGLAACGPQNTAWFGLQRLLQGHLLGDTPVPPTDAVSPYAEVAGLDAAVVGSLAHVLDALTHWHQQADESATPAEWGVRGQALLARFFKATDDTERLTLSALADALSAWLAACELAGFDQPVPWQVATQAWLDALQTPTLERRFQAGGVTFCTLMPLRAVPFEVVCLLGMNDGDYPRPATRSDFDLMGLPGQQRPGDRSRRWDDRQLMLEALLSARRVLYVSWCGRSVRDHSAQAPSVLVSQLRDHLAAVWGQDAVNDRTTEHPLQPFSRRYFPGPDGEDTPHLFTHAREWRAAHSAEHGADVPTAVEEGAPPPFVPDPALPLTLDGLTHFLRNPVKAFFRHRLQVVFAPDDEEVWDDESFGLTGLEAHRLRQTLLDALPPGTPVADLPAEVSVSVALAVARVRQAGQLPLGVAGRVQAQALADQLVAMQLAWGEVCARFPLPAERRAVRCDLPHPGVSGAHLVLEDWLDQLRQPDPSTQAPGDEPPPALVWLTREPGALLVKSKTPTTTPKVQPHKLLGPWVRCLAAAASGVAAHGVLVGQDATLTLTPPPPDEARATLETLLAVWQQGMTAPLPMPLKTAIAWAQHPADAAKKARTAYEGGFNASAEGDEPCLARVYPRFADLLADGRLPTLAAQVHQPLLDWVSHHVTIARHPVPDGVDLFADPDTGADA